MSRRSQSIETSQARIEALGHELRLMIVLVLSVHPATATEIAEELGEPADKIRYQLRVLRDAGLIEVGDERQRRGVIEKTFVVREEKTDFSYEESLSASRKTRSQLALNLLRVIFKTSLRALSEGALVEKKRTLISMIPMRLDKQGWDELAQLHRDHLDRTLELRAESASRLEESGEHAISATSAVLWLENPPRD